MRLPLDARIYVAGHDSPLGRMLCRKLHLSGYRNVITREAHELNLRNQLDVNLFFEQELPDYVFLVNDHTSGQIAQVMNPAEFLYARSLGLSNVIHASYVYEVSKLLNIIFTVDHDAVTLPAPGSALNPAEEPSTEALIEMLTLGLCDRYRRQYDCDFISARFHLNLSDDASSGLAGVGWPGSDAARA
ncbi:NAD-dependent epimerase/dehydratase family protein, partial [Deinococcus sp.]|uniref:NAD-dependent epimerase/dehydratase family protein n=1 Tax=Deinococcus sp. TaxID=47478 RepID=UPI002869D0D8